ncbi:MAG: MOSC domain-containing protein [Alphaproteobacteria bacterium]
MAVIDAIYRYPVKGLSPEPLDVAAVAAGGTLALDRAFAVAHGSTDFDPAAPQPMSKRKFLQLMENERLATLSTRLEDDDATLVIERDGRQVSRGRLDQPVGRKLIEQFLDAYLKDEIRGPVRIVSAPGHHFADVPQPLVSLINRASVAELSRVAGTDVDPMRFRGNLYLDGLPAWAEFGWLGQEIALGDQVKAKVVARIERCAAVNVDPASGARDMNLPRLLNSAFGHVDMGVYAAITTGGEVRVGDALVA